MQALKNILSLEDGRQLSYAVLSQWSYSDKNYTKTNFFPYLVECNVV